MRYVSTRGGMDPVTFRDAVIIGQAPDGGLLLPEVLPDVSKELEGWRQLSFEDLAFEVIPVSYTHLTLTTICSE